MLPELVLADLFMAATRNKTQSFPTVWFRSDIWKHCFATSDYVALMNINIFEPLAYIQSAWHPNSSAKLSIKRLVIVSMSFWENSMDYLDAIKL